MLCPSLKPPNNGFVQISSQGTEYNATYTCSPNFQLVPSNSSIRICNESAWIGVDPKCGMLHNYLNVILCIKYM